MLQNTMSLKTVQFTFDSMFHLSQMNWCDAVFVVAQSAVCMPTPHIGRCLPSNEGNRRLSLLAQKAHCVTFLTLSCLCICWEHVLSVYGCMLTASPFRRLWVHPHLSSGEHVSSPFPLPAAFTLLFLILSFLSLPFSLLFFLDPLPLSLLLPSVFHLCRLFLFPVFLPHRLNVLIGSENTEPTELRFSAVLSASGVRNMSAKCLETGPTLARGFST